MRVDPDPPRRRMRSGDDPPSCRDSVRRLARAPEPKLRSVGHLGGARPSPRTALPPWRRCWRPPADPFRPPVRGVDRGADPAGRVTGESHGDSSPAYLNRVSALFGVPALNAGVPGDRPIRAGPRFYRRPDRLTNREAPTSRREWAALVARVSWRGRNTPRSSPQQTSTLTSAWSGVVPRQRQTSTSARSDPVVSCEIESRVCPTVVGPRVNSIGGQALMRNH